MQSIKEKQNSVYDALKGTFGYKNKMQTPKLLKAVISTGTGSITDKRKLEIIPERLALITGQKASSRSAKQSIASFKLREGDTVGYAITLRGARMFAFLDKFVNIAIPRTRDFKGLSPKAIDDMGNLTIGVREHTIFPEVSDEELTNVFGLSITLVSTAKTKEEARAFFDHLGIPFKKD